MCIDGSTIEGYGVALPRRSGNFVPHIETDLIVKPSGC